jgi:hypothetical protein
MMVQRFANAFGYWADLCAGKVDVEGRSGSLGVDLWEAWARWPRCLDFGLGLGGRIKFQINVFLFSTKAYF